MKIAYLLMAHSDPVQLLRLAARLNTEGVRIFIHLDRKTALTEDYSTIQAAAPGMVFIKQRTEINWGAYSLVDAVLKSLQEILDTDAGFDYIILMSGSDYPIRNNRNIMNFLAAGKGREFIHCRPLPAEGFPEGRMDRIWYYYDYDNITSRFGGPGACAYEYEMRRRGIKRNFIRGMVPYHGSTWWCLTGKCIEYILDTVEKNIEINNFFRYTKIPDEQFFQTLVMNSPFAPEAPSPNLWYLDWSNSNASHPKILGAGDLPALKASSALFARKFDRNLDSDVLDLIDMDLLGTKE